MENINKSLKSKGFLYLSIQEPIGKKQKTGLFRLPYKKNIKVFINLLTEKEMKSYLKKAKFKILSIKRRKSHKGELPFNKLLVIAQKA